MDKTHKKWSKRIYYPCAYEISVSQVTQNCAVLGLYLFFTEYGNSGVFATMHKILGGEYANPLHYHPQCDLTRLTMIVGAINAYQFNTVKKEVQDFLVKMTAVLTARRRRRNERIRRSILHAMLLKKKEMTKCI